ncbi:MAG: hypothetical protein AB8I08_32540 [Sandaracinaceae bacterium]
MRALRLVLSLSLLAGCVEAPPELCVPAGTALSLSEGGRAVMSLPAGPALTFDGDAGLEVITDAATLTVLGAYGSAGPHTLTARAATPGDCTESTLEVEVRPLVWEPLDAWDPAVEGPPAREYGSAWVGELAAEEGLFLFGGFHYEPAQFTPANDLWFYGFTSAGWTSVSSPDAPMVPGARAAEGATPGSLLFHGGGFPSADGSLDTPSAMHRLSFDGETPSWGAPAHAESAPGSYTGAFVRDVRRARWLSVCGADAVVRGVHCDVLAYSEAEGWSEVAVAGESPPGRFGFHYGMDEENDRFVIAAGQGEAGPIGDTWALDLSSEPPRWERLFEDTPEVRRRNGAFVMDPVGQRLLVWGGTADGRNAVPGLSVLRLVPGHEGWAHIEMPASVVPRASGFGAYDAGGSRALFGLGNGTAIHTDLYALSL